MRGPGQGAFHGIHIGTPKPISTPPKIQAIRITPVSNGLKVSHVMHNAPAKHFVFADPMKMAQHLRRIENHEWMRPGQNPAGRVTHVLDLGETP